MSRTTKQKRNEDFHFEMNDLKRAFAAYLSARLNKPCRLVVSFHEYSEGIWLEFSESPLDVDTDFVLQTSF